MGQAISTYSIAYFADFVTFLYIYTCLTSFKLIDQMNPGLGVVSLCRFCAAVFEDTATDFGCVFAFLQ